MGYDDGEIDQANKTIVDCGIHRKASYGYILWIKIWLIWVRNKVDQWLIYEWIVGYCTLYTLTKKVYNSKHKLMRLCFEYALEY